MIFYPTDRVAVFIDGANLYATARILGIDLDYRKLKDLFAKQSTLIRAYYYTALYEDGDFTPLRPLVDWLDYNGYTIITKRAKEFTDDAGRRKIKGNMDIEIAVDMLSLAQHVDHVVLFSGDGDFRRLIEAMQRRGVRVTVVSTIAAQPPLIADELRRQADNFIDLNDIRDRISRAPSSSSPRPERLPKEVEA